MTPNMKLPGVTAVVLAILFPIYWIQAFGFGLESFDEQLVAEISTLSFSDIVFALIGLMEIYLYLSLREVFKARIQGSVAATILLVMAIIVGLFHSLVLVDILFATGAIAGPVAEEMLVSFVLISASVLLFVYAVFALVLAIVILLIKESMSRFLSLFAVLLLVCALVQLSIFLSFLNVLTFPVALVALALYFFRGDHEVEVV